MRHSDFVHLHLHTQYSLLDGAIRLGPLFERIDEHRMPAVAMTDHGNLFGAIGFYRKALDAGIKPIIGCEVYVAPGDRRDRSQASGRETNHHLTLLIKNLTGYKNLVKLVSEGYLTGFYYRPRIDKELLREHSEGLICLSGCMSSEVVSNLVRGQRDVAMRAARFYRELFADRFYIELQDQGLPEQRDLNEALRAIAREIGSPVVATNDCHYVSRDDAPAHEVLLCIQTGKTMSDSDRMRFATEEFYVKSPEEMKTIFGAVPEAVENTLAVAERCNLELRFDRINLPNFAPPDGTTLDDHLRALAIEGLERRFAHLRNREGLHADEAAYQARLDEELSTITGMEYSSYFLIVWDFIDYAKRQGIPVGPGRGSAAGSLVAYALGITDLDPLRYGLLFERFLNPGRISMPDIDVDFCMERRDEVIDYVVGKYGRDNVAQIITFGSMAAKAVIRDVGRAYDMPYGDVDRIAKLVPDRLQISLADAQAEQPRLKALRGRDERVDRLLGTAERLEGLLRHASTHAAGVVISPWPLVEMVPLYKGAKGEVTTQYAMHDVEALGLPKMDFLGLKTLTLMANALKLIEASRGLKLALEDIPLDDPNAYQLLSEARTLGVFQLESRGIRDLLGKLMPTTLDDVIATVALYRPGPLGSGMVDDFILRKHGQVEITYEVPELEEVLRETYGVIVYQEQVMEIASRLGGFTLGEADILRRAMGKKLPEEMALQRERFLKGAKERNIGGAQAERIFKLMEYFAGYGFNKSHSAAYGLIAYHTAYLKANYPVEFMAALLTSEAENTDKVMVYMNECREMGITVSPPDVNESDKHFTVVGDVIRFGLAAVKNVGGGAVDAVLAARAEGGALASLADFCRRVDLRVVNRRVVESLVKCGAFDFLGRGRAPHMRALEAALEAGQRLQRDEAIGQVGMFAHEEGGLDEPAVDGPEWSDAERLIFEKEALGFYITGHPLAAHTKAIRRFATATTASVADLAHGEEVALGGLVVKNRILTTKRGDRMSFITLEDLHGFLEVIVFPDIFQRVEELLMAVEMGDEQPVMVRGTVDVTDEAVKVIASSVTPLEEYAERVATRVTIQVPTTGMTAEDLSALKAILERHPGDARAELRLTGVDRRSTTLALDRDLGVAATAELIEEVEALLGQNRVHFA
ncbi:MAG: DNA polymerase III subunit alpha [bacterium]|nr:DNA polymerase III subunit alpha [bacterium]